MTQDNEQGLKQPGTAENPAETVRNAFEQHSQGLWRFLVRLTGREDEAEEVVQETFVRALKGAESFRGGNVSTWLFAIALNVARSRWRSQRREAEPLGDEPPSRELEPSESAGKAETGERVRRAVQSLPEPQRVAVLLSRFEGLPYAEIARIEECTEDAVKQRVRRAMARLREELKGLE